eukprot:TRINITY_DN1659_c0_g2_i1.p1 TRINITY_DN1659_c0_g2~~TRINITY_DN1659_c0_g2_i1.p1  ORF type:complete len:246 (+),score=55.57 TRINITY_DN1659_c0_g2_i1:140-877(+)
MYRDGQMRAALDHEAQARVAHQRNAAWKALHTPSGMQRVERYQTSDPTLSLATVQDGRPVYDFAAAPSLFLEEDLRQEKHMLQHRKSTCEMLKAAEVMEAQTVATRIDSENKAQACLAAERGSAALAAEAREIEVRSVEQRSAIEAACDDAEQAFRAAMSRAHELRDMLSSAQAEQERASAERLKTSKDAEDAAKAARDCESLAVEARRAQDCAFAERRSLETKSYRQPVIQSVLGMRGGYLMDH